MISTQARELLFTWNEAPSASLARVKIEDDSLRDGLQGAYVRKPDLEQKKQLIALSAAVGTQAAMLGLPASSALELAECRALVEFIEDRELPIVPRFLARAVPGDVAPIIALHHAARRDVWADFFIGCSPLRRAIETWSVAQHVDRIASTAETLRQSGTPFGISLEDATRTPPADLRAYLGVAIEHGARVVTVCDTAGDATPEGAAALVGFVRHAIAERAPGVEVWWHGHNDRGLALASSLAAAAAGADAISGAFLGIGERTGNTPLEQVVMFLAQHGNPSYRIEALAAYCRRLAEATATAIPDNAPLFGRQAFATCTGTHSAALLKARHLGGDLEDYVFSSVPASRLGRDQAISIGPTSGQSNALHILRELGLTVGDDMIRGLVGYAKAHDRALTADEIRRWHADATESRGRP